MESLGVWNLDRETMRLPQQLFGLSSMEIACFLRHLWAARGTLAASRSAESLPPMIACTFASEALAHDVVSLLLRLGINARLAATGTGEFAVRITGRDDMLRYAFVVGAAGSEHMNVLPVLVGQLNEQGQHHNMPVGMDDLFEGDANAMLSIQSESTRSEVYWDPIISIELDSAEEVFDLTVPGPHNFIAGDIIVHNSIEQDADVVMFVHRPEYYGITVDEDGMPTEGTAELIIGKQRNGPTGTAKTAFIKEYARFENLAFQYDNAPEYLPPAANDDDAPF
jgi:replicative DNA helicase